MTINASFYVLTCEPIKRKGVPNMALLVKWFSQAIYGD